MLIGRNEFASVRSFVCNWECEFFLLRIWWASFLWNLRIIASSQGEKIQPKQQQTIKPKLLLVLIIFTNVLLTEVHVEKGISSSMLNISGTSNGSSKN